MADKFFVDGMTIQQIMNLDYSVINNMNKRDLSRALRTLSLAANKRVKRLRKNREDIAEDALNWLSDQGYSRKKFGSKNKSLNEMRSEFLTVRQFLGMKTSTVRGALSVRKGREQRIMGQTREQAVKAGRSAFVSRYMESHAGRAPSMKAIKAEIKRLEAEYKAMSSSAWSIYRKMLEAEGWPNSPYQKYMGSDAIIEMIGQRVASGDSEDNILQGAINAFDRTYTEQIDDMQNDDDNGLDMDY